MTYATVPLNQYFQAFVFSVSLSWFLSFPDICVFNILNIEFLKLYNPKLTLKGLFCYYPIWKVTCCREGNSKNIFNEKILC